MDEIVSKYDISKRELARGRNLKIGAFSAPFVLGGAPAALFLLLMFVFGSTPPVAATFFFIGLILTIVGFVVGLGLSGLFAYKHSNWTHEMRERIAADGIKAQEIDWFRHELKSNEKRALKEMRNDPMLLDAYRETLASRLTATRIVRSSKKELLVAKRRQSKLKQLKRLKTDSAARFNVEIERDLEKIGSINDEAKLMLAEAESRLQMIEAASIRGSNLADSELALKKLSARASELPIALEEAKMAEEIRRELEEETEKEERK